MSLFFTFFFHIWAFYLIIYAPLIKILKSTKFAFYNFGISFNLMIYRMSKKSWPNLYSKLLYKLGKDFLKIQYLIQEFGLSLKACKFMNYKKKEFGVHWRLFYQQTSFHRESNALYTYLYYIKSSPRRLLLHPAACCLYVLIY